MMCIIATVSMVESTGVYLALSDLTKDPIDSKRLRRAAHVVTGLGVWQSCLENLQYLPLYRFLKILVWLSCLELRLVCQSTM